MADHQDQKPERNSMVPATDPGGPESAPAGAKNNQIEDTDPATLQDQAIPPLPLTQPPAGTEQNHSTGGRSGKPKLERYQLALGGTLDQEGDTDKQNDHAYPQHQIAAGEELGDQFNAVLVRLPRPAKKRSRALSFSRSATPAAVFC
jgi:hypothetical protein